MDQVDVAILDTLHGTQRKYKKDYSKPGQERILERILKIHKVQICRRTLNYRLRHLEDAKIIKRYKRHYKHKDGSYILRTTAYYLLKRGSATLRRVLRAAERLAEAFPVQKVAPNIVKQERNIVQEGEPEPAAGDRTAWLNQLEKFRADKKRSLLRKE